MPRRALSHANRVAAILMGFLGSILTMAGVYNLIYSSNVYPAKDVVIRCFIGLDGEVSNKDRIDIDARELLDFALAQKGGIVYLSIIIGYCNGYERSLIFENSDGDLTILHDDSSLIILSDSWFVGRHQGAIPIDFEINKDDIFMNTGNKAHLADTNSFDSAFVEGLFFLREMPNRGFVIHLESIQESRNIAKDRACTEIVSSKLEGIDYFFGYIEKCIF